MSGTLTLGRLRVDVSLDSPSALAATGAQSGDEVEIAGWLLSGPTESVALVAAKRDALLGMRGQTVAATWSVDPRFDGYWRVRDVSVETRRHGSVARLRWSAQLTRVGSSHDTDVESRLTGVDLANDHALTGERWHAPAPAHEAYHVGDTVPGFVDRVSADGDVRVYRALPAGADPQWGCPAGAYLDAAARLLVDGRVVAGDRAPAGSWQVDNAVLRVLPAADGFAVAVWDGAAWQEKSYRLLVAGSAVGLDVGAGVLRNDPEEVAVRLTDAAAGRLTVDVVLRRGSRTAWLVVQRFATAALRVERAAAEEAEAITGGITAQGYVVSSFASPGSDARGLAHDGTNLWHADRSADTIYELNPADGSVVSSFASPGLDPIGLTWDGASLWNADRADDTIYELDTAGTVLSSFASPGTDPRGLAWDGTNLWHVDNGTNTIYKLDTTGTVLDSFAAPGITQEGLTHDGTNLWLSDNGTDTIYKIDPATGTVLDSFAAPGPDPQGLAWDGTHLWNADNTTDTIYELDPDGDKDRNYVIATSKTHTTDLTQGAVEVSGTLADFAVGYEEGAHNAAAGDTADDLVAQYVGARAEHTRMVRR